MSSPRALLLLVLLSSCVSSSLVPCGDQLCPAGDTCVQQQCASPEAVIACEGQADAAECTVRGLPGECRGGACIPRGCGNALLDADEACDDGNIESGDGCRADCLKVEVCGDAKLDQGEACDDGNTNDADGCDGCVLMGWDATVVIGGTQLATKAGLGSLKYIAADHSSNLYVTMSNGLLRRVDPGGFITTIAGSLEIGFSGDGGPATAAILGRDDSIVVDHLGNIYLGETSRIRRIDTNGVITTIAGTGVAGFSGDNGLALTAQINAKAIAVDGLGQLYFIDAARIRRIDTLGYITTVAGTGTAGFTGDMGLATAAQITPEQLAVTQTGAIYIGGASRVRLVDTNGTITTVAGGGALLGEGVQATDALINVTGVTVDPSGILYVSDRNNHRVRRVSAGVITTVAGSGTQGFSGDGGAAVNAQLTSPTTLTSDGLGNVFIVDAGNGRVRRLDTAGILTTVAGSGAAVDSGTPLDDGVGGFATGALLLGPRDVALDTAGRPIIVDEDGHRIYRVEATGILSAVAGTTNGGFSGDGGPATAAQIYFPYGVTGDASNNIYIADYENNRIRRTDAGGQISTIAGTGTPGFAGNGGPAIDAQIDEPGGLAIDDQGRLLMAEYSVVRRIDADGALRVIAGTLGSSGYSGENVSALTAVLSTTDVATDTQGNIYLAEFATNRVRRIDALGVITTIAGNGSATFTGDGGPATAATLYHPFTVACGPDGTVYINDRENNRIRRIVAGTINTIAGDGVDGQYGDGGIAVNAAFQSPAGMAADANGNLYVADYNAGFVRRIDAVTNIITTIAGQVDPAGTGPLAVASLADPRGFVITPSFTVFAGGRSGVVELARATTLEAAVGRYPQSQATGTLARYRDENFGVVAGVAYDTSAGTLYLTENICQATVCTYRIHAVTAVDPADAKTWTIAPLSLAAGTPGAVNGPVAAARFRAPEGLWLDETTQKLYVADTGNHAIRVIDLTAGMVTTFAGTLGVRGAFGDGGVATAANLYGPTALTTCPNGDMFIADTGNHRVRRVTTAGAISTVLGNGVPSSSGDGAPAATYPVDAPRGVACDAAGNVYVTSRTTVRMLPVDASGIVDGSGAVTTIYGASPRDTFPARSTSCLTGIAIVDATHIQVTDACAGMLVGLERVVR